jgi:hypothetical protein
MPTTITNLPAGSTPFGGEAFAVDQSGATRKLFLSNIFQQGGVETVTSLSVTNGTITYIDESGTESQYSITTQESPISGYTLLGNTTSETNPAGEVPIVLDLQTASNSSIPTSLAVKNAIDTNVSSRVINDDWGSGSGGDNLYVRSQPSWSQNDPYGDTLDSVNNFIINKSDIGLLITNDNAQTEGPGEVGICLYNDDATPGAFAPMITFAKREFGTTDFKTATAAIYSRTITGTTDSSDAWIDGELIFATSGYETNGLSTVSGLSQRMVIDRNGRVGINEKAPTEVLDVDGNIKSSGNVICEDPVQDNHAVTKGYLDSLDFSSGDGSGGSGGAATYVPIEVIEEFEQTAEEVYTYNVSNFSSSDDTYTPSRVTGVYVECYMWWASASSSANRIQANVGNTTDYYTVFQSHGENDDDDNGSGSLVFIPFSLGQTEIKLQINTEGSNSTVGGSNDVGKRRGWRIIGVSQSTTDIVYNPPSDTFAEDIRTTYISGCFDNDLGTSSVPAVITSSSSAPAATNADKVWNSISNNRTNDWSDTFTKLATLGGSDVSKTKIRITATEELGAGGGDDEDSFWFDITIDWEDNEVSGVGLWNAGYSYTTSYYLKNVPILVDNDFQILETTQQAANYGLPRLSLDIINRTITGIPVINYNQHSPQLSITIEETRKGDYAPSTSLLRYGRIPNLNITYSGSGTGQDLNTAPNPTTIGDFITSRGAGESSNDQTFTCTFNNPLPNNNYSVIFEIISNNYNLESENSLHTPVVIEKTESYFKFNIESGTASDIDIDINIRVESNDPAAIKAEQKWEVRTSNYSEEGWNTTEYVNDTGSPIILRAYGQDGGGQIEVNIEIDGVGIAFLHAFGDTAVDDTAEITIPAGSTWKLLNNNIAFDSWQTWTLKTTPVVGTSVETDTIGDLSENGWTKLPNGLIMQWGVISPTTIALDLGSPASENFNIPFPNNCFNVTFSPDGGNSGDPDESAWMDWTRNDDPLNSFKYYVNYGGTESELRWQAIGN